MKVAIIADIHGNADALAAVLAVAAGKSVELLLVAGDFVGYYYEPKKVFCLLNEFEWIGIRGNHERMIAQWIEGQNREWIKEKYGSGIKVAAETLSRAEMDRLLALPQTRDIRIDGFSVFLCHGSPWEPDQYVYPDADEKIKRRFNTENDLYDMTIMGHTHYPFLWNLNRKHVLNPGSVGQTRDGKPGACWALWDTAMDNVDLLREKYDASNLLSSCTRYDPENSYLVDVLVRT